MIRKIKMLLRREILFCDFGPTCYAISENKEIFKRHIKNLFSKVNYSKTQKPQKLKNVITQNSVPLIKKGKGIDPALQYNKAENIQIASDKMNGIEILPGEIFSFWELVGNPSRRNGFKEGRVLQRGKLIGGIGGGLCNLANSIHRLVLHSPLEVVEFHSHSDALAPDGDVRVPFSSGTSVTYNYLDYRFKNNTDQPFQLFLWNADEKLHAELRADKELPHSYRIVEEGHHFAKEGDKYFRISKIYKETIDKKTQKVVDKKLVLDNHSEVMYDYSQINMNVAQYVSS